jgi:hypothetical protein
MSEPRDDRAEAQPRADLAGRPPQQLSAYHDMPYALFRYDPPDEFDLRKQVTLLETRLTRRASASTASRSPSA